MTAAPDSGYVNGVWLVMLVMFLCSWCGSITGHEFGWSAFPHSLLGVPTCCVTPAAEELA